MIDVDTLVEGTTAAAKLVNILLSKNGEKLSRPNKDIRISTKPIDLDKREGPTFSIYDHNKDNNRGDITHKKGYQNSDLIQIKEDPKTKKIQIIDLINNLVSEFSENEMDAAVESVESILDSSKSASSKPKMNLNNFINMKLNKK